ncbi:MAG: radical SAM protein [Candidatus Omnitrophica bacterium]|nr:radical SAM protein [Candidatus Omnitrophota bacterium]MDD5654057.1 radical SAM protein [Candidatus Omnitrophota bacterium]
MEKQIEAIIDSFRLDLDQRKLEVLDKVLFSLLLRKELLLLEGGNKPEILRLGKILSRYYDYRTLIARRIFKSAPSGRSLVIKHLYPAPTRLILLITHSCQLKCRYCRVRKFSASMDERVLLKGVELLFTSNRADLQLQFFGGEPILKFDLVREAVEYAKKLNRKFKKDLTFILTTNGIALTREKVDYFKENNFIIECSIDGEIENQLKMRRARGGRDYYSELTDNLRYLFSSGVPHYSISVVMPDNVWTMSRTFEHLVKLGFKRLQMNYALGVFWSRPAIGQLFVQTEKIERFLKKHKGIEFVNLSSVRKEPVVLNSELTVDCDGGIYLESGICLEEDFAAMKKKFLVADVNRTRDINLLASTPFQNFYRLSRVYAQASPRFRRIILNNIFLGRKYDKLIRQWI